MPAKQKVKSKELAKAICKYLECKLGDNLEYKKMNRKHDAQLIKANLNDYPVIQNMARFYVYDMSRYCGHDSIDWACPADGLYECIDFKSYFIEENRHAYYVKIEDELAGFVLINKNGLTQGVDWVMGEFFILARFQGAGISQQVAKLIWDQFKGAWEVRVIPENIKALKFWRKIINEYSMGQYSEELVKVGAGKRYIFKFVTSF